MAWYRHEVHGGEYVIEGGPPWRVTFNGVQIGGVFAGPEQAIEAVRRCRSGRVVGPDLTDVAEPPASIVGWMGAGAAVGLGERRNEPLLSGS